MIDQRTSLQIQAEATREASRHPGREFSLYIDEEPLPSGRKLGPAYQNIETKRDNLVLVFLDEEPLANFGHDCRYLLYDPATCEMVESYRARFPPYPQGWPPTFRRFAGRMPVRPKRMRRLVDRAWRLLFRMRGPPVPQITPELMMGKATGRRIAVLLCGNPDPSHVNTMEFCYRLLLKYGFTDQDIRVLNYLGTSVLTAEWAPLAVQPTWPGDDSMIRLPVAGPGFRQDFVDVINNDLKPGKDDLLFIHTTGHGDGDSVGGVFLATAIDTKYYASELAKDLQQFPKVGQLLVLMEQCCSGGFQSAVMQSGKADEIAFACSAGPYSRSYNTDDLQWNSFAREWIASQFGTYPDEKYLVVSPDTGPSGVPDSRIDADEAYVYASKTGQPNPDDTPLADYSTAAAKQMCLDGQ